MRLPSLTNLADDALIALDNLGDRAASLVNPTIRLGVTGLSRAGKTVFISSLVHNLLNGGRLPLFEPMRSGRTMLGSCALLNTIDISAPIVAATIAQAIGLARSGRPG